VPFYFAKMYLAQLNIAHAIAPMDSNIMADFVNNTDRINALAEKSPGFIWRLTDEENNNAYSIQVFDNPALLTNMSVWKDRESLFNYVYSSDHVEIFKRKKEWFANLKAMHMVLWYIDEGHIPTLAEGKERLEYLQKYGESEYAFTFKSKY
jgi:hypothetical protein